MRTNINEEYRLRFGNNVIIDKEKYLEYSSIVEKEIFNNIDDAKNKAIGMKLNDMNTFISIFVKSGITSPKYIVVPLKNREIAHSLFYEEAIDVSTLNTLASYLKNLKIEYNKYKDEVLQRINSKEYHSIERAKNKAKSIIASDNDYASVWGKDAKYYVVLSSDRAFAFRNNYKELVKYYDLFEEMNERKNKIRGSLIGGAIGDALGYQIEFKRNVKDKEVTNYKDDKGIISDDTQMTLFTANALLWRETRLRLRGIAPTLASAIYESYLDWLDTQNNTNNHNSISWIKNIPELNIGRAPGNTCLSALSSGEMGTLDEPINNSKGCGGIMRVAPIGLYVLDSKLAGITGAKSSAITHGHPLGILPCYILASMLNMIVYNNETIEAALDKSIHQYYDEFNKFNKSDVDYLMELINKAKKLAKEDISDTEAIASLGEGWVAEETFAIAIYSCLKYSTSFQDAIICSVNHDGDSDSTGAVAGNIIGAYLGYNSIPTYYKDNVELKDVILELADDMSVDVPISEYSSYEDERWENKYVYCKYVMGEEYE